MRKTSEQLLRECIRSLLNERDTLNEDVLSGYGFDAYDAFLAPFVDAGKAVGGEIGKISAAANAALETIVKGTAGLVIPFYEPKYSEIRAKRDRTIEKIERDLGDVWKKIEPAFYEGTSKLFFLYNPVGFIAGDLIRRNPTAALSLAVTLSAGLGPASAAMLNTAIKTKWSEYQKDKPFPSNKKGVDLYSALAGGLGAIGLKELLSDPKVQKELRRSPIVSDIKNEMADVNKDWEKFAKELVGKARIIEKAKTFEDIKKADFWDAKMEAAVKKLERETGASPASGDSQILKAVKVNMLKGFLSLLESGIKLEGLQSTDSHPLVSGYKEIESLIGKVQSK